MVAAGIVIVFILLMIYGFVARKMEESDWQPPENLPSAPEQSGAAQLQPSGQAQKQSEPAPSAPYTFSQSYSFGNSEGGDSEQQETAAEKFESVEKDEPSEDRVREITHSVLASRKKQMAELEPVEKMQEQEPKENGEQAEDEPMESTLSDDDIEHEIEETETLARQEGEATEDESDQASLEETIAKLEEIRARLRERQFQFQEKEENPDSDSAELDSFEPEPKKRKPTPKTKPKAKTKQR
jgi:hypothetical protein